ncbi:MAG: sigma-70 family RNA polymerase sigma factor [Blastomonas sp.]
MTLSGKDRQSQLYRECADGYGATIARIARGYERDDGLRADLEQEIHLALWRSLAGFEGRCALSTWVYRIAHNVAASHVDKARRSAPLTTLDDLCESELQDHLAGPREELDEARALDRLYALVHRMKLPDRQIMLLYLEGLTGQQISEITGLSPGNISVRIHRVKQVLRQQFESGEPT